jgi:membrane-associated phospholipid phosphatase
MGYHYGRYQAPPSAPVLPSSLDAALAGLPTATTDASLRLPVPRADAARRAELPIVRDAVASRDPSGIRWASYMDSRGATSMWWGSAQQLRRTGGLARSIELRVALVVGQVAALVATHAPGQTAAKLQRPFQLDTSIALLGMKPNTSSYPSGHARTAYAMARIVARLDPSQADQAYEHAGEVARSRVYAAAHLPSDVLAGARLGTAVGDAVVGAVHVGRVALPVAAVGAAALEVRHLATGDD